MQTFAPHITFADCARSLDRQRLGKQRVEAWQILTALRGTSTAWGNHPAVQMWRGYEAALEEYYAAMVREWITRGYNNTMSVYVQREPGSYTIPDWFGREDVVSMYRAVLVGKLPTHYAQQWPDVIAADRFDWQLVTKL